MKKLIILLSLMTSFCFASSNHGIWVVKSNKRGNYDCEAPSKHKDSPNYSYWSLKRGWRNCEIVPQNDEVDQMLKESVGKVVTLRGSYVEDEISVSNKVQRAFRFFAREVIK